MDFSIDTYITWTGQNHREMYDFLTTSRNQIMTTEDKYFFIDHSKGSGGLNLKISNKDYFVSIGSTIHKKVRLIDDQVLIDFNINPLRPVEYVNITFKILKTIPKRATVGFWGILHDILKGTS